MTCKECTYGVQVHKPGWEGVYCPISCRNVDAGNQACDPVVALTEARAKLHEAREQIAAMARCGFEGGEEDES